MPSGQARQPFAEVGATVNEDESPNDGSCSSCGILGFTDGRLCGSVVGAATQSVIAPSNPRDDGATRGWVAGLTNPRVGRFQSSRFRHGIEVAMSIPAVPLPHTQTRPIGLAMGDRVTIWLELELFEPGAGSAVAAEGAAMLC